MNATEQAIAYIKLGWRPIALQPRSKRPISKDWPSLRVTIETAGQHFNGANNIGLLLGDVSGGLVDIDLDNEVAIRLAPRFLPATRGFGRKSRRQSHRLYLSRFSRVEKFQTPEGAMLVELRANSAGGLQTMAPGSVHPSGEPVEWENVAEPLLTIKPNDLRTHVAQLAAATLLVLAGWTDDGAERWARSPTSSGVAGLPKSVRERVCRWLGVQPPVEPPVRTATPAADNRIKRASAYLARIPGGVSESGGHQQTWMAALHIVRGFELSEADAYDLLAREYNHKCSPPWTEVELRHKVHDAFNNATVELGYLLKQERARPAGVQARQAVQVQPQPAGGAGGAGGPVPFVLQAGDPRPEWEAPVEFTDFDLPIFPVSVLPPAIGEFVSALSEATQTPPDLAGMLAVTACAAACAKRLVVEVKPGYREPVNLFTAVILPPGERKSSVMSEITAPLKEWENKAQAAAAPAIARAAQQYALSQKRLDNINNLAAKEKNKNESDRLEMEALDMAERHAKLRLLSEPRILADDATPEALGSLLSAYGGRMAIFSAEGGVFTMMAGKYADSPSLDVYLKAHAGDEIRVDRKGRPSEHITDPALTLGLAVQPSILQTLAEQPMLRGTGLIARFAYALPPSKLGYRAKVAQVQPVPDSVRAGYATVLRQMLVLQEQTKPLVFKLTPGAYSLWSEFADWVEPRLAEFGEFQSIRDWAGKLPGLIARIAGVFRIIRIFSFRYPFEDPSILNIDEESMGSAIALGRYLIPHAQAAISSMRTDERTDGAKQILACISRHDWKSFSRSELHQMLRRSERFTDGDNLIAPLGLLMQRNFIREATQPDEVKPGRKPSPRYEVNPQWAGRPTTAFYPKNPSNKALEPIHERVPGEDDE